MIGRDPRARTRGLTLVETSVLLCILGVFLAVSIPTFVRTLRTSKISEASEQLAHIYRATAAYYATPQPTEQGKRLRCLPEPAGPAPAQVSPEPVLVDFGAPETPGHATWRAIGFQPGVPVRYRYSLLPAASGCGVSAPDDETGRGDGRLLTLRAEGDLDGDGQLSTFERSARAGEGELIPDPLLFTHDRVE
jgi:type II secretory pathway pseudopilin PulG